jgi:hypothetical protein
MGQQLFGKFYMESLKLLDGVSQVDRVPEHNRGNNQAEAICPVLLVLVGSVSQFAETIEKHSPRQGISSLAFVEAGSMRRRNSMSRKKSRVKIVRSNLPRSRSAVASRF